MCMKNMIETLFIVAFTLIGVICVTACSDKLDVQQVYAFHAGTAQGSIFRFVIAAVQRTGADAVGA